MGLILSPGLIIFFSFSYLFSFVLFYSGIGLD